MESLRFDGQVAIVTSAGRGIGRSHAMLLAERGARVVVNDLGTADSGTSSDPGPATRVADEIRASGGYAIADVSDVATDEGAANLVRGTIDAFGRVDVLVNNAGTAVPRPFPGVDLAEFRRYFDLHVAGSFNVTRECWPYMAAAKYGRIVMTMSHGLPSSPSLLTYGSANGSVFALTRDLAGIAMGLGITVNSVAPVAAARFACGTGEGQLSAGNPDGAGPALVSPLVALLCHESCPVTGETLLAGGRRHARLFVAETEGCFYPVGEVTAEDVSRHWDEVMDESYYYVPRGADSTLRDDVQRVVA